MATRLTLGDVHTNKPMTNIAIAFRAQGYVWREVFPMVSVTEESDLYFIWDRASGFADRAALIPPGGPTPRTSVGLSTGNYNCQEWRVGDDLPDRIAQNQDAPLSLMQTKSEDVSEALDRKLDVNLASTIFTTSVWTGDTDEAFAANERWNSDDSEPLKKNTAKKAAIRNKTGKVPNRLLIGAEVWDGLQHHPDLLNRAGGGDAAPNIVSLQTASNLMGIQIVGGEAVYNSTPNASSATYTNIWGKSALWLYVTERPNLLVASAGYTIMAQDKVVRTFPKPEIKNTWIDGDIIFDQKVTSDVLGAYASTVVD